MRSLVSFNFFVGESQRSDRIGVQLPGVQNVYLFDESWYAGGGPAATFFLCFAKERRQRKATQKSLPATRIPKSSNHQSGAQTNSPLAQTGLRSLSA